MGDLTSSKISQPESFAPTLSMRTATISLSYAYLFWASGCNGNGLPAGKGVRLTFKIIATIT